jgi:hypothetical protein
MVPSISPSQAFQITYTVRVYYRSDYHTAADTPSGSAKWKILQNPQSFLNVVLLQLS